MSVLRKFNKAVKEATAAGDLDPIRHGAVIEAARKVARLMDDEKWPIVGGKIDNVSPSVFLKYCEELGLTAKGVKNKKKEETSQIRAIGNSKWRQA